MNIQQFNSAMLLNNEAIFAALRSLKNVQVPGNPSISFKGWVKWDD